MLRVKKISEVLGKNVYTSEGDYFGQLEEVNLVDNKVDGWKIRLSSGIMSAIGGAKGVIIPHQFVKAVGDIFIITKTSLPNPSENENPVSSEAPVPEFDSGLNQFSAK